MHDPVELPCQQGTHYVVDRTTVATLEQHPETYEPIDAAAVIPRADIKERIDTWKGFMARQWRLENSSFLVRMFA